jgi:hypothetical protein
MPLMAAVRCCRRNLFGFRAYSFYSRHRDISALREAPLAAHPASRAATLNPKSALIQAVSQAEHELETAQNDLLNIQSYLTQGLDFVLAYFNLPMRTPTRHLPILSARCPEEIA